MDKSESYGTQSHIDNNNNNSNKKKKEAERVLYLAYNSHNMPGQAPQWMDFLSCEVCYKFFSESTNRPISLGCGHTVCKLCLSQLQQNKCPFDQSPINCDIDKLPVNYALLQLIGAAIPDKVIHEEVPVGDVSDAKKTECYETARKCIEELAVYLKPLSEDSINELEKNNEDLTELKVSRTGYQQRFLQTQGGRLVTAAPTHSAGCILSRPMQRKLLVLINCQLVEEEGRSRAARAARSLGERSVTELILAHQNPQQLSANLWAAVRTRGCQFLGPGMQEEVLRLILLALEDGSALSRKVLVLFVVQRLERQYPQASKTAIGHVVQLLYRASCFKVTKREEESSLMQLKEEFRSYEALRLEHDAQIVQIAMEAGLRISPEQWSSLLYGDATHKSHMQSIIDKHQSPQSFSQGINELVMVLQRLGDPSHLNSLRPHLDFLAKIDPSPDCPAPSWEDLEVVMKSLKIVVQGLVDFVLRFNHRRPEMAPPQNTRFKTSMCRDFTAKGSCPRGGTCTFAHSQEELEQYRCRSKKLSQRGGLVGPALMGFNPRQRSDGSEVEETSHPKHRDKQDGEAGERESGVGTLAAPMANLSISASHLPSAHPDPTQPLGATPHYPHPLSRQPPAPGAVYPIMQHSMALSHPGVRLPYSSTPSLSEGIRNDQLPGAFAQGVGMHFHAHSELGVPYRSSSLAHHLSQPLPGPSPPNPPPHPHSGAHPPLPPRMSEVVGPAAPCVHQVPTDMLHPGYSVGRVGGPVPPYPPEPYIFPSVGEMPNTAMAGAAAMASVQTLEKLRFRKSELISNLQCRQAGPGGAVGCRRFDGVVAACARPSVDPLSSSVKDSVVAMRTTNTLDDLEPDSLKGYQPKGEHLKSSKLTTPHQKGPCLLKESAGGGTSSQGSGTGHSPVLFNVSASLHSQAMPTSVKPQMPAGSPGDSTSLSDLSQEGERKGRERTVAEALGIGTDTLENEDDFIIPFDPPLVSRFGPISRNARIKLRNTDPVQVTAEENTKTCTPVLSVTPLHRPYPTSAPVPSLYKPQMTARPAPNISVAAPLQPPPTSIYTPWSGGRCFLPEMVQKLEKGAVEANSTSERLALQLQSVELQISMKTGENPKPVSQLLQEAGPKENSFYSPKDTNLYSVGEEAVRLHHSRDRLTEWK